VTRYSDNKSKRSDNSKGKSPKKEGKRLDDKKPSKIQITVEDEKKVLQLLKSPTEDGTAKLGNA